MRSVRKKPNAILKVGPPKGDERTRMHPTRQRRYSKKVIIEALRASNGMITAAARRLGCDRTTVRNYFRRYPELDQALQDIRDSYVDLAESSLLEQVKEKNTQATIFLLKCLGKGRGWTENPNVQLHAHVEAGSGTWLEIMERAMARQAALPESPEVTIDIESPKLLEKGSDGNEDDEEICA